MITCIRTCFISCQSIHSPGCCFGRQVGWRRYISFLLKIRLMVLKWTLTFAESDPRVWSNFIVRAHLLHFLRNYSCVRIYWLYCFFPTHPRKSSLFSSPSEGLQQTCLCFASKLCFFLHVAYGCVKLSIMFVKLYHGITGFTGSCQDTSVI